MKKRFTEAQIIGFLREAEAGFPVKDLCRRHGFSEASYYLWRSKFGGMSVSDAKRLKELETENGRLKKLLAESQLEIEVTREGHCQLGLVLAELPHAQLPRIPVSPAIISHAVWLYHRFALSFRDVEDLLARRGVEVTYEAIRKWCRRFGPEYAGRLRRRRGRLGDTWHLDEVFVTLQGRQQYLWHALDEDGDVLDILVQPRRNRHAAVRFFRKLLKTQRHVPRRLITDKLRSYSAACHAVMPSVFHCTDQYANNRAEVSHQPTRQRERQMRRFKSAAQLQRFASVHGIVQNLFRVGRHLLRSAHHRLLRTRAFVEWDAVTCAY